VQRAVAGQHRNPASPAELGHLFESLVLNEIRMLTSYMGIGAELAYWRTEAGTEVDLVWHRGDRRIGFEIKHRDNWSPRDSAGLMSLMEAGMISRAVGIYTGTRRLKQGAIVIFPFAEALEAIRI
jgi:predicted AAA+ superfamily ATPase